MGGEEPLRGEGGGTAEPGTYLIPVLGSPTPRPRHSYIKVDDKPSCHCLRPRHHGGWESSHPPRVEGRGQCSSASIRYPTTNQSSTQMIVVMMIMIIVIIIIINIIMSMGLPNTPSRSKHAGGNHPTHTTPQGGKGGNHQSPHPNHTTPERERKQPTTTGGGGGKQPTTTPQGRGGGEPRSYNGKTKIQKLESNKK